MNVEMRESPGGLTRCLGSLGYSGYYTEFPSFSKRSSDREMLLIYLPWVQVRRPLYEPFPNPVLHIVGGESISLLLELAWCDLRSNN